MTGLDHVVLLVEDLTVARRTFEESGFTVSEGGTHAGGLTQNALIPLSDGSYIELLAFTWTGAILELRKLAQLHLVPWVMVGRTPLDRRFVPRGGQTGLIDVAIACSDMDRVLDRCRAAGQCWKGPVAGSRVRTDGVMVEWRLAFAEDPRLPFLIEDITDRALRVPGGTATDHANGVSGIAKVSYLVPPNAMSSFEVLMRILDCTKSSSDDDEMAWNLGKSTLSIRTDATGSITPSSLALRSQQTPRDATRARLGASGIVIVVDA